MSTLMTVTAAPVMSAGRERSVLQRILGVPLVVKLIGANVVIVVAAVLVHAFAFPERGGGEVLAVAVALTAASLVNFFLTRVALGPVEALETLAQRVSAGDFRARAGESPFADDALIRLGSTINNLLDALAAEKMRIQKLGAEVIYAQDAERARVARELHDSIAQTLAAVRLQLVAASSEAEGNLRNRIVAANGILAAAMEEVRSVSYSLHPRVAEDLGLESALDALASQVHARSGVEVHVTCSIAGPPIPANVRATLFRVAQEALRNVELHSRAKIATVDVVAREGSVRIEVTDDGCGFDATAMAPRKSALAAVQDRVMLAGGVMKVDSVLNGGTRVTAELQTTRAPS